jgi:flagellar biosynthesis protein FliQ
MIGASGGVLYIFIPLLIIAVIIGITISYFRKKAKKNRNF